MLPACITVPGTEIAKEKGTDLAYKSVLIVELREKKGDRQAQ